MGDQADALLEPDETVRWRFGLWKANRLALAESGVPERHVSVADLATRGGGTFFSGREQRPCGRFAVLARLTG